MCENEYVCVCAFANICVDRLLVSTAAASPLGLLSDSPSPARSPSASVELQCDQRALHTTLLSACIAAATNS
jgi:hypothetical protein